MLTAVYDGNCVICNTTRRIIRALDWFKRVEFLDLHDHAEVTARYPSLDQSALMGEIHVIDRGGRVFPGFLGTRRMLRAVPLGWPLWLLLHVPGVGNWLGPALYRFIARHRYAINQLLGVDLEQRDQDCEDGVCKLPE
jgi:predicted DCC family thiol-disulfide oxidoreductase YuxK